jgi:hypothetical protein
MSYHFSLRPRGSQDSIDFKRVDSASDLEIEVDRLPDQANTHVWRVRKGAQEFGLFLSDGEYWSERLNDAQIEILVQLGEILDADVVGEQGETYGANGRIIQVDCDESEKSGFSKPSFFKRHLSPIIISALCLLGLLISRCS